MTVANHYIRYRDGVDDASGPVVSDWAHTSSQSKSSTEESGSASYVAGSPSRKTGPISPSGSPPLQPSNVAGPQTPDRPPRSSPQPNSRQGRIAASSGTRSPSMGGGVQMVLDETSSWSELANQSSSMSFDGKGDGKSKSHGMLGFLSRKRGRGSSPKPQEPGVLGREGARVIMG